MPTPLQQFTDKLKNRYSLKARHAQQISGMVAGAVGGSGRDMDPVTPISHVYDMPPNDTGFASGGGQTFWSNLSSYTDAQLTGTKYVYAPGAQQVGNTIRLSDLSRWQDVKAEYASRGLQTPLRLVSVRHDICRFNAPGFDIWNDANIYQGGPTWELDDITSPPGAVIPLPPVSSLEVHYKGSVTPGATTGLSFADAYAILNSEGWSWSNYDDQPFGDDIIPYSFQVSDTLTFRIQSALMKVNDDDWIDSISDFLVASVSDANLGEQDGIMIAPYKNFIYSSRSQTYTGVHPGGEYFGTGSNLSHLEYWVRTRDTGPAPDSGTPWDIDANDPTYHYTGTGPSFDYPVSTGYDYIEGLIKLVTAVKSKLPLGKELHCSFCYVSATEGLWYGERGFTLSYRDDYVAAHGGTRQAAQYALLDKMEQIAAMCHGIILPPAPTIIVDPSDAGVYLEPSGWWESMHNYGQVQYAS